jgi:hypothetical protein
MKRLVCSALFFFLITGTGLAQTAEDGKVQEQQSRPQPEQANNSKKKEKTKPDEEPWPPPFTPSEEVGADAMISFPTDI